MVTPQQESSTPITILERIQSGEATTYLVPSDSDPAAAYWLHTVRHRVMGCSCRGWQYRGYCHHAVRLQVHLDAPRCQRCGAVAIQRCPSGFCPSCCSSDSEHLRVPPRQEVA